ncbi:hypothetical protein HPB51_029761 [Rhipicephalus microplus]|uniref:ATP-dependent RNA helicase n=1 Tax=Rhipicephalus microplus TaxID=6941 RepID=A0A9J6CTU7_RHIMP|nr:hypothetical protein HPB51_029761 [Rhipicephalus microplus]
MSEHVDSSWTSLKVHDEVRKAIQELHFEKMTPVQALSFYTSVYVESYAGRKEDDKGASRCVPSSVHMLCEADQKLSTLVAFLRTHSEEKHMVFFSTCACVEYFSAILVQLLKNMTIISIHGKMKRKRQKIFNRFMKMHKGVLVCTDVMARGVDIPDVQWVVQYDAPKSSSSFIHRCGRTARMGNEGNAVLLLMPSEDAYIKFLELNQKAVHLEILLLYLNGKLKKQLVTAKLTSRNMKYHCFAFPCTTCFKND